MSAATWGLLGPETIGSERRTRTLNLGATVRAFNDLAVPGMGGVWFGKQLFLATLGVDVAQRVRSHRSRVSNIVVANAIEALGCWLALHHSGWQRDRRVRGANKMHGITAQQLAFERVRKPSFYVTQPMRQATIQPLRDLGLVESTGERFNGFASSDLGENFIKATVGQLSPFNRSVQEHLASWVSGKSNSVNTSPLRDALSPTVKLPRGSREILKDRICAGDSVDANRRVNALRWVESRTSSLDVPVDWNVKPEMLETDHWRDLRTGSHFFLARDAAIELLDQIESIMGISCERELDLSLPLPSIISERCQSLREAAETFLDLGSDPTPNLDANRFCRECSLSSSDVDVIRNLLAREGRVLQLKANRVVPGSAFSGTGVVDTARSYEEGGTETPSIENKAWPRGISHRIENLFLLSIDLEGELDDWLASDSADEEEQL